MITKAMIFKIAYVLLAAFMSFLVFRLVRNAAKKASDGATDAVKNIDRRMQKTGDLSAEKKKLSKLGICYRFGDYNLAPSKYVVLRVFWAVAIAVVMFLIGAKYASVFGLLIGYFGIDVLFKVLNKRDNEAMFEDIYSTYSNLKIQLSSGIYIGDCLDYTYTTVKNKRYAEAMKELIMNFSDKTLTSAEAIDIFRDRFNSREIDKLCNMMTGFVQYGISEEYLSDIMREVESLMGAQSEVMKNTIEGKTALISFGFFALIIAQVILSLLQTFKGTALF